MRFKWLLFCFLILLISMPEIVTAQVDSVANKKAVTDCEATLAVATGEFNAGRFFSLPSILKGCIDRGFTPEQKIRAYILLCQVYLINDNPQEAEASYLKLLQINPEYIAKPEIDPIDVVYLSKKFTTRPVFTPHVRFGVNTTVISKIHSLSGYGKPGTINMGTYLKPGIAFGGGLDWNLSDRISLAGDFAFATRKFSTASRGINDLDRSDQLNTLYWFDVPVYLKYQDYEGKFRPYGYVGYAVHVTLRAQAEFSYLNKAGPTIIEPRGTQIPTEGTALNVTHRHYLLNQSLLFGGGIKYKMGKNYLFADLRFYLGLTNLIKQENVFYNRDDEFDFNVIRFNEVGDMYRVNTVVMSVGYIFPVYNPRKKGGWEPKGIIGKILYGNNAKADQ